jgi:hypothetical protein
MSVNNLDCGRSYFSIDNFQPSSQEFRVDLACSETFDFAAHHLGDPIQEYCHATETF